MKKIYLLLVLLFILSACNDIDNSASKEGDAVIYIDENKDKEKDKDKIEYLDNNKSKNDNQKADPSPQEKETDDIIDDKEKSTDVPKKEESEKTKDSKNITDNLSEKAEKSVENKPTKKPQEDQAKDTESKQKDTSKENNTDKPKSDNKDDVEDKPSEKLEEKDKDKDNTSKDNEGKNPNQNDDKQEEKEESESKEEKPSEKLESNSLYLDSNHVPYLDLGINNYDIEKTQSYIDMGNIIATVTKFNPNDNEITYFAGHTYNFRGVNRLKTGSIVTVTDSKGNGFKYKIIDWAKYPAGMVDDEAPFIGGYHLSQLAGDGIGVESIVVQYCDDQDVPMIFFGVPIK